MLKKFDVLGTAVSQQAIKDCFLQYYMNVDVMPAYNTCDAHWEKTVIILPFNIFAMQDFSIHLNSICEFLKPHQCDFLPLKKCK